VASGVAATGGLLLWFWPSAPVQPAVGAAPGQFHSRSVHTSRVANKIPGIAKKESRTRRLSRFLDNGDVRVREWYQPTASKLLQEAAKTGCIRLIIDATKVAQNHQLLMVSLAHRRRSLPLVWTWIRSSKGHSSEGKQAALLQYVHDLLPSGTTVVVTGDSEFTPLQGLLEQWRWYYALRQKGSHLLRQGENSAWQRVDSIVTHPGESVWLPEVELTKQHRHPCNLFAYWRKGEKVPWLLATNLPSARQTHQHYKKRAWIEEMFGDFKGNGVDLEASCLHHFLRLSRLTLVVALLYVWLFAFGTAVIKRRRSSRCSSLRMARSRATSRGSSSRSRRPRRASSPTPGTSAGI
jgi:hypothetical protein